ncbi:MAG: hypothetical protein IJV55_05800 [Paludibacteraceae bacterium]|nr:hypothetical protein [Paludibacteraceae bacterium]
MKRIALHIIPCLIALLLTACHSEPAELGLSVSRCADLPVPLTAAASFSIGGKAYIACGRSDKNDYTNRLYAYDPQADSWTDLGSTPLSPRVRARAAVADERVYIGLGFCGRVLIDTAYLADWWCWNPADGIWLQRADYPSTRTVGPVVSADGQTVYAAYGGQRNYERWVFRYDISSDSWTRLYDGLDRMASYPPRAHSVAGCTCGGRLFVGTGYFRDSETFWAEAETTGDSTLVWHRRAAVPGKRHNAAALSDGRYIYLAGGRCFGGTVTVGGMYDDVLRYDPDTDTWVRLCRLPDGGRENLSLWLIDGILYAGGGSDINNRPCRQLYRITL